MSMLNDDVNQLERFLNGSFKEILQLVILVLVAGWALFSFSWQLGAISMASIPFIIWGSFWYQKTIEPHYQKVRSTVGELSNRLENNLSGIAVIKSFTAEEYETQRVNESSQKYQSANFGAIQWNALYVPLIRMVIVFGYATALLLGGYWVINGMNGFSIGSMAFVAMMLERLLWPITRLGDVFDQYERAKASSRRIFGLIDAENKIMNPANPEPLPENSGQIALKNITFWYKRGQAILDNISLTIQKGQTIGIAGPTGGGKTTLIKLLLRLYDVKSGSIEIEGIDIKKLTLKNLRQNIGFVSQEVYLFHGSIQENIAYGMPNTTKEAIIAAAKKAQLHDFIATLPQTYHTIVGERGND